MYDVTGVCQYFFNEISAIRLCCCSNLTSQEKGVFGAQRNIYDELFIQKQLTAKGR